MDLLNEIIATLSSCESGTTNALIKTKVLLFKMGKKDLASWVNHELNGYPDGVELPSYRTVPARLLVNANNGFRSYKGLQVILSHLDDDEYEKANQSRVKLSISQVEQIVVNAEGETSLSQTIPIEIAYAKYCKYLDDDYEITRCYKDIALHNFTSILTQVRSRLLDFVLELSDQLAEIEGTVSMEEKLKKIDTSNLFNRAIFGDNTVINLGNNNSLKVTNSITNNDLPALKKHLLENGFDSDDVDALEIAIQTDGPIAGKPSQYGSEVGKWFAKIISKAAQTTFGIGVAATTEVATHALKKYYGFD